MNELSASPPTPVKIYIDYADDIKKKSQILTACVENKPCVFGNTIFNFLSFFLLMAIIAVMKWIVTEKMELNYIHKNGHLPT